MHRFHLLRMNFRYFDFDESCDVIGFKKSSQKT
jgi:hypothetical protein